MLTVCIAIAVPLASTTSAAGGASFGGWGAANSMSPLPLGLQEVAGGQAGPPKPRLAPQSMF